MSPLRGWMEDHGHPGWYSWVVVVGTSLASSALVLLVSLHTSQRSLESERQARAEIERSRDANRIVVCSLVIAQDDVYQETPPATPAGKNAAKAWQLLRQQLQCSER